MTQIANESIRDEEEETAAAPQYVPASRYSVAPYFARLVPEQFARSNRVVPLVQRGDVLVVAMADPSDSETVLALRKITSRNIWPVLSSQGEIDATIDRVFSLDGATQAWKTAAGAMVDTGVLTSHQRSWIEQQGAPASPEEVSKGAAGGLLSEDDFVEALGLALYLPHIHLENYLIEPAFARVVPREMAERAGIVPLFPVNGDLMVACAEVPSPETLVKLRKQTGYEPRLVLCKASEQWKAMERAYPPLATEGKPALRPLWMQLVEDGLISKEQAAGALAVEQQTGLSVEDFLVKLGRVTPIQLLNARARLYDTELVRPVSLEIDFTLATSVPERLARHYRFIVLRRAKRYVEIATVDPGDEDTREMLRFLIGQPIRLLMCTQAGLEEAITLAYGSPQDTEASRQLPFPEFIVRSGRLAAGQVAEALDLQQKNGRPLEACLIELDLLDGEGLAELLALHRQMPSVTAPRYNIKSETLNLLPEPLARQHGVLPLYREGQMLSLALSNPQQESAIQAVQQHTGLHVRPILAGEEALAETIDRLYRVDLSAISQELQSFGDELVKKRLISRDQLFQAWAQQLHTGLPFDMAVTALGYLTEQQMAEALSQFLRMPTVELAYRMEPSTVIDGLGRQQQVLKWIEPVDSELAQRLPEEAARRYGAIPFRQDGNTIMVAFAIPVEEAARLAVEELLKAPISIHIANRSRITEAIRRVHNRRTLGDLLVETDYIGRRQLQEGLELHRNTGVRLGKALMSLGHVTQDQLVTCLSEQMNLPYFTLSGVEISDEIARIIPENLCRQKGVLPLSRRNGVLTLAMTDPLDTDAVKDVEQLTQCHVEPVITTDDELEHALEGLYRDEYLWTSANDLVYRYPDESASRVLTRRQKVFFIGVAAVSLLLLIIVPIAFITFMVSASTLFYLCFSTYKFYLIYKALSHKLEVDVALDEIGEMDERDLPIYTVLIPLYRESEVLPTLVRAIDAMDYPKTKLDVKLLLEEDDTETIEVVSKTELPAHFKPLVVPHGLPKGKPKACNYGLIHAEGEYTVIYDAEDVPDPNQLKMAVAAFRKAGEHVACIQAKLNYYNRDQNLLTRWFTTEYSMWFDLFIPGLDASNSPIPLGGTSNHFRTAQLKALGAWDPYNVTEDADLGVRLFKAGGKTAVIDSTTYEEANSEVYNWIRQRSRWVKGYVQTWLVHMRHPVKLAREIGFYQFFSFNMVIGGTFFGFLMNPIYWALTAAWFLTHWELIQQIFPRPIFYLGSLALYFGNFAFMYTNVAGCMRRRYYDMVKYALISPLYWALMSIGAWKGFIQLFYKASYWEKTKHGLYRGEIGQAISVAAARETK